MHVTRGLAALVLLLPLLACDRHEPKKVTPPVLVRATAPPLVPVDPAFLKAARAVRDAATVIASKCRIFGRDTDTGFERFADTCPSVGRDADPLKEAASVLGKLPPTASGPAALFAEEARLFTGWIELVKDDSNSGTLAHYQGLAAAWNELAPDDRIPVDPVTKSTYDRKVVGDAGVIVWSRCSTGPCVLLPTKAF